MSYSFYSIVNSIKDKSSEAISTLSSDLKDFTAIVQEDVAEISKTVRQTVQEKSEQLRQRAEQDAAEDSDTGEEDADGDKKKKKEEEGEAVNTSEPVAKPGGETDASDEAEQAHGDVVGNSIEALRNSIFSFDVSSKIESLESMGSKLLNSADQFIGALSGENAYEDSESEGESEELSARRFRLLALQEDSETYVEPPLDVETFQKWKAATPATEIGEIQTEVLEHYPTVRTKFAELVPSVVDADTFWTHYIYKASLLAAQEQRGADLLEHALNDDEEEIGWDVESPKDEGASDEKKKSLFVEEESKEEPAAAASATPDANGPKPGSSTSSDGESWIELDERKDHQAPLSTSSAGSSTQDAAASSTSSPPAAPFKPKDASIAEDEDGLDWGDDAEVEKTTTKAHEDKDKHGEDWGEWD